MERAGRIIYDGAVGVSLLLFLATVGVWVRSYWVGDKLYWYDWPVDRSYVHYNAVESSRGGLRLCSGGLEMSGWYMEKEAHFRCFSEKAGSYPLFDGTVFVSPAPDSRRFTALGIEFVPYV